MQFLCLMPQVLRNTGVFSLRSQIQCDMSFAPLKLKEQVGALRAHTQIMSLHGGGTCNPTSSNWGDY